MCVSGTDTKVKPEQGQVQGHDKVSAQMPSTTEGKVQTQVQGKKYCFYFCDKVMW